MGDSFGRVLAFINGKWFLFVLFLLSACVTGLFASIPEESGSIEVFFCDQVDCKDVFYERVQGNPSCAFYNLGDLELSADLVVDGDHAIDGAVVETGSGLMHNKFCVWDDFVWTGSWNPSQGMSIPNNVVLIQSKTIADAYRKEFVELKSGVFHGGRSAPGLVYLNGNLVEAYFCPEDDCKEHVMKVLKSAKSSIHFMTYSFTDDDIGDLLFDADVEVKGIFDPRKDKYSEYDKLKAFSVVKKVHHKVFIVDRKIVITGSYNPTRNGNVRNDENVLIVRDPVIAELFEEEFARLFD